MQIKYCNGIPRQIKYGTDVLDKAGKLLKTGSGKIRQKEILKENPEWKANKTDDASFNGILFRNSRVYIMNIYTFDPDKDYQPSYLDITEFFNEMLSEYNIYHLCIIIPKAVRKLYGDCTLTENLIPFIKYDRPYRLPKLRYKITSTHAKERKFIESKGTSINGTWNQILHRSLGKFGNLSAFREQRNERCQSLYFLYTQEPELRVPNHRPKPPDGLPPKGERKARRRFGAFGTETWRSDWTDNPDN